MVTVEIEAREGRDVAMEKIPGAYLNSSMS